MRDPPSGGCLDVTLLLALAQGQASVEDRSVALVHLGECAPCRDALAELCSEPERAVPDEAAAPGVCLGDRYTLVEPVGEGAWGVVWAAVDERLGRKVALKLLRVERSLNPDDHYRIVREAEALARLSHPSVVAVHDSGDAGGRPYLVMDLIEGVPLPTYLAQAKPSAAAILGLFEQAGAGLAAAHRAAIVHRDFKPANLLVDASGGLRVTDFGLAAHVWAETPPFSESSEGAARRTGTLDLRLTPTQGCLGTPAYLAPEVLRGEMGTPLSDQFAFCVSLVEALTGAAFMTVADVRSGGVVRSDLANRLRQIPAPLRPVVARGLDPYPSRRYSHIDALLEDIRSRARRRSIRRGLLGAAGILGVLAIVWLGARERRISACVPQTTPFTTAGSVGQPVAPEAPGAMANVRVAMQEYQDGRLSSYAQLCRAADGRPTEASATERAQFYCLEKARVAEDVTAQLVEEGDVMPVLSMLGRLQRIGECAELSGERVTAYISTAEAGTQRRREFMKLVARELLQDTRPELEALLASLDPSSALAAEVLTALGVQTANLGSENEVAIDYFERAFAAGVVSANRRATLLAAMSLLKFKELDPTRVDLLLKVAEPLAASEGHRPDFLSLRARLSARRGRFEEALADIDDALEAQEPTTMVESLRAKRLMVDSLQTKAQIQTHQGEHAKALDSATLATREQLALLGPDAGYAVLLAQLGGYAERASRYDQGQDVFDRAARLFAEQGKPALELRSRVQQARQLSSLMRWDEALELLNEVKVRAESLGLDANVAEATTNAAYLYGVRGDWAQRAAMCALNGSATLAAYGSTHVRTRENAVFCLDGERATASQRERLANLVTTLEREHDDLSEAAKRTSRNALVRGHCELARAALRTGELDLAEDQARAALQRAREVPNTQSRWAVLLVAAAHVRLGRIEQGRATLDTAVLGARADTEHGRDTSVDLADHLEAASRVLSQIPNGSERARALLDEARERLSAAGLNRRVAQLKPL